MESPNHSLKLATAECLSKLTSVVVVSEEQRLDGRALLRWADDGGRWVEGSGQALGSYRI
jgi:hypothetical protein